MIRFLLFAKILHCMYYVYVFLLAALCQNVKCVFHYVKKVYF